MLALMLGSPWFLFLCALVLPACLSLPACILLLLPVACVPVCFMCVHRLGGIYWRGLTADAADLRDVNPTIAFEVGWWDGWKSHFIFDLFAT